MFFILCTFQANAQIQPPGYRAEFGSILQAGSMKPFWLISNQGGKYHPDNSSLFGGYGPRITTKKICALEHERVRRREWEKRSM
jgi:hypothetical protein